MVYSSYEVNKDMVGRYIFLVGCLVSACTKLEVPENTAIADTDGTIHAEPDQTARNLRVYWAPMFRRRRIRYRPLRVLYVVTRTFYQYVHVPNRKAYLIARRVQYLRVPSNIPPNSISTYTI